MNSTVFLGSEDVIRKGLQKLRTCRWLVCFACHVSMISWYSSRCPSYQWSSCRGEICKQYKTPTETTLLKIHCLDLGNSCSAWGTCRNFRGWKRGLEKPCCKFYLGLKSITCTVLLMYTFGIFASLLCSIQIHKNASARAWFNDLCRRMFLITLTKEALGSERYVKKWIGFQQQTQTWL